MDDDDGFGVDVYVDDDSAAEDDAAFVRRRSSRAALASKADAFLRRHSGSAASDAAADSPRLGGASSPAAAAAAALSPLSPRADARRRRDAESVRRDKERLQRFASEAASFLDKAYDNDEGLIVDDVDADGAAPGERSSEDFRAKRHVELDKARLERFSREAEAFIDAAYGEDEGDFIEEELLSPRSSAAAAAGGGGAAAGGAAAAAGGAVGSRSAGSLVGGGAALGHKTQRNKAMMTQFHTQVMSVFAAREKKEKEAAAVAVDREDRLHRRISSKRIARDKEVLEEHYRDTMAFLERAEAGEGIIEETELDTGSLERVRLKLYAEEAMNFLEKAFKPDSDILVEEHDVPLPAAASTDEETAQIRADRAAMERYYEADNFGEDGVVEETLSDTSGGTDRGLFARRVGGEGTTPTDSSADDEWGGADVDTDEEGAYDDPTMSSSIDMQMNARASVLDRELLDAGGHFYSHGKAANEPARPQSIRPGVIAADLPPELPDFPPIESPVAAPSSHVTPETTPVSAGVARSSSVAFADDAGAGAADARGRGDGDGGGGGGAFAGGVADDCLVELLLQGTDGVGANSEWSEVPLEKSFYRSVPRGATIKLRSRASQRLDEQILATAADGGAGGDVNARRASVGADRVSTGSLVGTELARVEQERDAVMAALEEIVNERSRMAAQISDMKGTIAETFGRARPAASEGGDIDVAAELKDAYAEFEQIIRESEATVNVLEGHIGESNRRVEQLEKEVFELKSRNTVLERDLEGRESRDIAARATTTAESDGLRKQLAAAKEEQRNAVERAREEVQFELVSAERKRKEADAELDELRAELRRKRDGDQGEKGRAARLQGELDAVREDSAKLEKETARAKEEAEEAKKEAADARKEAEEAKEEAEKAKKEAKDAGGQESGPAVSEIRSTGGGSGGASGHLWMQLSTAREEADEARKGQERAERRLREVQLSSSAPSYDTGGSREEPEREKRAREEAVAKITQEKDDEITQLWRRLEDAEASRRAAELAADEAKRRSAFGSDGDSGLKADLAMTTRRLEDTRRRLDALEIENKSAMAARKSAEAEAEVLRSAASSARATRANGGGELTALQAELHGLREEVAVKERSAALSVDDATARAMAAEDAASRARTELIEAQQNAEREVEKQRRARKAAESQRDALQAELDARKEKSRERKAAAMASAAGGSAAEDGKGGSGLGQSSSKRGIGAALRKSSSKVGVGKKKDEGADGKKKSRGRMW